MASRSLRRCPQRGDAKTPSVSPLSGSVGPSRQCRFGDRLVLREPTTSMWRLFVSGPETSSNAAANEYLEWAAGEAGNRFRSRWTVRLNVGSCGHGCARAGRRRACLRHRLRVRPDLACTQLARGDQQAGLGVSISQPPMLMWPAPNALGYGLQVAFRKLDHKLALSDMAARCCVSRLA